MIGSRKRVSRRVTDQEAVNGILNAIDFVIRCCQSGELNSPRPDTAIAVLRRKVRPEVAALVAQREQLIAQITQGRAGEQELMAFGVEQSKRAEQAEARADAMERAYKQAGKECEAAVDAQQLAEIRADALQEALERIRSWDCLNPPRPDLLADLPWLRRLVDAALADRGQG